MLNKQNNKHILVDAVDKKNVRGISSYLSKNLTLTRTRVRQTAASPGQADLEAQYHATLMRTLKIYQSKQSR